MSLRALETGYKPPQQQHGAVQPLAHQFEDLDQQNESYIVGMWTFLVTEIMFFGALFLAYSVYRVLYTEVYLDAHQFLSVPLGTLNTFVLLFSSFAMAMGVMAAQHGNRKGVIAALAITILCSFAFLGVKYVEYSTKFREHLFPGPTFDYAYAKTQHNAHGGAATHGGGTEPRSTALTPPPEAAMGAAHGEAVQEYRYIAPRTTFTGTPEVGFNQMTVPIENATIAQAQIASPEAMKAQALSNKAQLFFSLYFAMTGLHAVHIIVGILMMGVLIWLYALNHHTVQDYMPTEMIGLYWHFVDIVWIFLFPMMYLIS